MNDNAEIIEKNIDWQEVEYKISILLRKFSNIDERYRDDLAQELRIYAYYTSDDYYDLYRRAIDFWRTMTRRVYPEIPFIDLEIMGGTTCEKELDQINYEDTLNKIRRELSRGPYKNIREKEIDDIARRILDIITEDIDGKESIVDKNIEISLSKYHNGRINLSYLDLRMPDVHYKRLVKAGKRLEEVVSGLKDMGLI